MLFVAAGSLFHRQGAAVENAQSPNRVRFLCTFKCGQGYGTPYVVPQGANKAPSGAENYGCGWVFLMEKMHFRAPRIPDTWTSLSSQNMSFSVMKTKNQLEISASSKFKRFFESDRAKSLFFCQIFKPDSSEDYIDYCIASREVPMLTVHVFRVYAPSRFNVLPRILMWHTSQTKIHLGQGSVSAWSTEK